MQTELKQFAKRFRLVKRLVGAKRARETRAFAAWWRRLRADSTDIPEAQPEGVVDPAAGTARPKRVLLATSLGGWQPGTRLDSILATSLRQRGAEADVWLCDEALPACQMADAYFYPTQKRLLRSGPRDLCAGCYQPAAELFDALGVRAHRLGALLTPGEAEESKRIAATMPVDEIPAWELDGIRLGEHAMSGALRFYARGDLNDEPDGEEVLRTYLRSALYTFHAIRRLLDSEHFDCVVLHHGIYVPQGPVAEICRARGIRVATWHPDYRRNCFTFAKGDTYHREMIVEPVSEWEDMEWSAAHESAIMDYLQSRQSGAEDWISFNREPEERLAKIADELGLDASKPWIGLLTTVMWDARLHYPDNAFPGVWEWVRQSIEYFAGRPDLQLVVRVHPAEVRGRLPARQLMTNEIARAFPVLPSNVVVIPAESRISSYALLANCDAALIYATKMGLELTATGIPTVVAGESWIRGKGFSLDAGSPAEYREILDRLPLRERMPAAQVERARKYAFHYFFRRMIPLDFVHQGSSRSLAFEIDIDGLDELRPGRHLGLDVICDGILDGSGFVYPAEREISNGRLGIGEAEPHQAVL